MPLRTAQRIHFTKMRMDKKLICMMCRHETLPQIRKLIVFDLPTMHWGWSCSEEEIQG